MSDLVDLNEQAELVNQRLQVGKAGQGTNAEKKNKKLNSIFIPSERNKSTYWHWPGSSERLLFSKGFRMSAPPPCLRDEIKVYTMALKLPEF